jgi:hypothetical protein
MKVLRTTDIITLKHGELEVDFSPLSWDKSLELSKLVTVEAGRSVVDQGKQTGLMIKHSVKAIRGLKDWSGEAVVIQANNGELSDSDLSVAINALVRTQFIAGIAKISTSAVPEAIKGVELLINGKSVELGK